MKSNTFHYSFPLILCFVYSEFILFIFSFQLPHKTAVQTSIFTYAPPSKAMVFLCLISSFIFELIKERQTIHRHLYPHHYRSAQFEDRLGMPPSYMVVRMTWDDDTEVCSTPDNYTPCFIRKGKSLIEDRNLLKVRLNLPPTNKLPWLYPGPLVPPVTGHQVMAMLTRLIAIRHHAGQLPAAEIKFTAAATENYEELCRLLTNNFNIFVVSSAVGVAITLVALKNQNLNLKQQNQESCETTQSRGLCSTA